MDKGKKRPADLIVVRQSNDGVAVIQRAGLHHGSRGTQAGVQATWQSICKSRARRQSFQLGQ